ncbi:MAG: FAD-dependent oxidoreductase [Candidatus Sungbacteria bacterium]|nr:FAD-dependent oxidoreductase [Candidatus Sungbacteria bacterium]
MKKINYLIIGGGIAGTTAAETIRRHDPVGSMAIVSDEPYRLYSRIMLSKPNFFLEKIPFDQIWLKKESWYAENNIQVILGKSAVKLNPQAKIVTLNTGEELEYEKLLLAVGGCARRWDLPGAERRGIFYLRTLDDAKAIMTAVNPVRTDTSRLAEGGIESPPLISALTVDPLRHSFSEASRSKRRSNGVKTARHAVAIGGGFVSFEMCDMLRLAGIDVTLLLRESYFWEPVLDETSGRMIEAALEKGGVKIMRNTEVGKIIGQDRVEAVEINGGKKIACDMLIVGIGVFCPLAWLEVAGVKVGRGILANEYLEINFPYIWVAGDAAEFKDLILGEQIQLGNWVNAQMQGRIAGMNMSGSLDPLRPQSEASKLRTRKEPFRMVSFYTTIGFGITIAFVGDVRPMEGRTIILRGSADAGSYVRVIVKGGEIIGATLINRTQELGPISKLIEKDFKIAGREKELADTSFDLKKLIENLKS